MLDSRPTFTACPTCGAALHRDERDDHVCDEALALLAGFDSQLADWLDSPHGRFAVWLAANGR
jgi:hypothetical protein